MGRRLAANIVARDPETGVVRTFHAGQAVPEWAAEKITNPDVWVSDDLDVGAVVDTEASPTTAPAPELVDVDEDAGDDQGDDAEALDPGGDDADPTEPADDVDEDDQSELERPPLGGKGSGRDVWAAYATAQGITVTEEMDRDDIIDAVEDLEDRG